MSLIRKIYAAGKKIQVIDRNFESLDNVIAQIGKGECIHHIGIQGTVEDEKLVRQKLREYGIE